MSKRAPAALLVLVGLLMAWGGWFVWRTSFDVAGVRTFCLFDDAMISMTYAKNLVHGYGFAWARYGHPVEGFTCPLWTFLMVPVHLLPIGLQKTSLVIQLASLACLVLDVVAVRRLVLRHFAFAEGSGGRTWLPAAALTAFYYPLDHWALQGMESGLQALLVVLAVDLALSITSRGERRELALCAVLAAAYLVRMDMALLVVVALAWVALHGGVSRARLPRWGAGLALLLAVAGGYELFRWLYYGDPLPNTYYLKLAGIPLEVRLLRGAWAFGRFAAPLSVPFVALAAGVAWVARPSGTDRRVLLPAAVVLAYFAYSIYVGGDAWEWRRVGANRFVCFVMPLVFVLFNALLNRVLHARGAGPSGRRAAWRTGLVASAAATLVLLVLADGLWDGAGWRRVAVRELPLNVFGQTRFTRKTLALERSGWLAPDARVAVVWAGIPGYFSTWQLVDMLGYNDRWVAHQPPSFRLTPQNYVLARPGHVKLGYRHALVAHRPDLVFQTWRPDGKDWSGELRENGYVELRGYWVRKGSDKVRWPPPGSLGGEGSGGAPGRRAKISSEPPRRRVGKRATRRKAAANQVLSARRSIRPGWRTTTGSVGPAR